MAASNGNDGRRRSAGSAANRPGSSESAGRVAAAAGVIVSRRAVLGTAALGALSVGCSDSGSEAASSTSRAETSPSSGPPGTTMPPPSTTLLDPVPYDSTTPYWLQGNFAPVIGNLEELSLEVEGTIPTELDGVYVRNGSNPHVTPTSHWFFGDGMLHSVTLSGGAAVAYRAAWIETPFLESDEAGFTTPPGGENGLSNVSVFHHGGKLLASGEVGWPYEIDPSTLETVGAWGFDGDLGANMTAHPKVDPATGHLHFFGYGFTPPYLHYYEADPTGKMLRVEPIQRSASSMIHDFAITETDVIFWEGPVVFSLAGGLDGVPFTWDPGFGARVGVMPLGGSAGDMRWVDTDIGYCFHGTNAQRVGDDVLLDLSVLPHAFSETAEERSSLEEPTLRRWTIGTGGTDLTWSSEDLSDRKIDFPMIDRRMTGRAHRHAWYVQVINDEEGPEFAAIVHRDGLSGVEREWAPGERWSPGEPFFVAAESGAEGEGWLLSYVYDRGLDRSSLAIFDALDVSAGPVGWVHLPRRVPYGFHGDWIPAAELTV